ncbi:Gfo/Idh/MocA family protein [Pedobacter cryotolerans]|uniref:Gfo/Idh/MocA family oxidoreductase n=1 Tax=Pedobacter cryotolerans TaxID=2571270 RepID=A0A4U1C1X2_9SPHI|nr:Gfo/Idh/MocA family oxidoreductase [Pedobacter cryotolerans]TKB99672.1 gfo/Idh/MocA family oxidoreductase [Pedobacter cryotolerans]
MDDFRLNRRAFVKASGFAGLSLLVNPFDVFANQNSGKRIGVIGLDTSHSLAFTKLLFEAQNGAYNGYKVTAAYPFGSKDLALSKERIPLQTVEIQKYNVKVVDSISALLEEVDLVLLETNDGRLHLEQALEVIKAKKPMFIDKPMAASLKDAKAIFKAAEQNQVPVFSSSSLRFMTAVTDVKNNKYGKVLGAETFSPATIEPTHPDLFWYGIHGIEALFALMGTGCKTVTRHYTKDTDVVVGVWNDGRIGTFRGTRNGKADFGGTCFCENETVNIGPYLGYQPLLKEIILFFETGKAPVSAAETLEILAFMEAADVSKRLNCKTVKIEKMYQKARF